MPTADRVLADTHTLLWWRAGGARLSATASSTLDHASAVLVSPLTLWEVAMLVQKGRVSLDRPTLQWSNDLLAEDGIELAPLDEHIAVLAAELEPFHGDPVDRMLVATARVRHVPLVTKDRMIHDYGLLAQGPDVIW